MAYERLPGRDPLQIVKWINSICNSCCAIKPTEMGAKSHACFNATGIFLLHSSEFTSLSGFSFHQQGINYAFHFSAKMLSLSGSCIQA